MPKNIFFSQNNYKHNITIQQYQYVVLFPNNLDWHIHTNLCTDLYDSNSGTYDNYCKYYTMCPSMLNIQHISVYYLRF